MIVTRYVDHDAALKALVNNPEGGVARELQRVGDRIADLARESIGTDWVRGVLNPPPGPPKRRSGDLQNSIRREDAVTTTDGLAVYVTASSEHRGADYSLILRGQGYVFLDLDQIGGV